MKVGFVQFDPRFGQKKENLERVSDLISTVEADLLVLPELFQSGYLFKDRSELVDLAEEIPGQTTEALEAICKRKNVCIVAGMAERERDVFFNSAVMVSPKGIIGLYRKIHLFMEEKRWFAPGNLPVMVYPYQGTKIGMMICFDWWFPEVSRVLALQGAHIVCHPSNLVLPHCQQVMLTRSLENRIFTITSNRTGQEDRGGKSLTFTGKSQAVGPDGKRLIEASADRECVLVIDINPADAEDKKLTPMNDLFEDRRVMFYDPLLYPRRS